MELEVSERIGANRYERTREGLRRAIGEVLAGCSNPLSYGPANSRTRFSGSSGSGFSEAPPVRSSSRMPH